ncbi:nucleoside deaminase [candidate division WOR-3 bacterium]|uniref:tRNA-specific adenosine deaminase n=1 Tax=candidate division WOR-3 bacterium TaxID=2052148 RepID=A0A660SH78_UNCW3|nr:MAG: nucleoside deaminase [candidate division WOR-3 bacterium]
MDEKFMAEALKEAKRAFEEEEVPIGAVCVKDGEIIGRGHNRVESLKDPTAHAEILALTAASNYLKDWRLEGVTIYVTVEPCLMCLGAIILARIERVVYGCPEPKFGFSRYGIEVDLPCQGGVMAEAAQNLLKDFFRHRRE